MKLKERCRTEILKTLSQEFGIKNILAVPKVTKVVINVGLKEAKEDKGVIEKVKKQLSLITGQQPIATQARRSISGFSLRAGQPIGVKVTLRGESMFAFLEKLFRIILPRIKDFQGLNPRSFDGQGNYNLGLTEQILFPELDYDQIDKIRGLEITIVTTTADNQKAKRLLELMGAPFKKVKREGEK